MGVLTAIEVFGAEQIAAICVFRAKVWTERELAGKDTFAGIWGDPIDDVARHWVIRDDDVLVGAIRLTTYAEIDNLPTYMKTDDMLSKALFVQGAIAVPERLVVAKSFAGRGAAIALGRAVLLAAYETDVAYLLSEASQRTADIWRGGTGRCVLGRAPDDPRFPGLVFYWMLTDVAVAVQAGPLRAPARPKR